MVKEKRNVLKIVSTKNKEKIQVQKRRKTKIENTAETTTQ